MKLKIQFSLSFPAFSPQPNIILLHRRNMTWCSMQYTAGAWTGSRCSRCRSTTPSPTFWSSSSESLPRRKSTIRSMNKITRTRLPRPRRRRARRWRWRNWMSKIRKLKRRSKVRKSTRKWWKIKMLMCH